MKKLGGAKVVVLHQGWKGTRMNLMHFLLPVDVHRARRITNMLQKEREGALQDHRRQTEYTFMTSTESYAIFAMSICFFISSYIMMTI